MKRWRKIPQCVSLVSSLPSLLLCVSEHSVRKSLPPHRRLHFRSNTIQLHIEGSVLGPIRFNLSSPLGQLVNDNSSTAGEDVGHYGGSYKVTYDLYKKFGEMRLLDTPICGELQLHMYLCPPSWNMHKMWQSI